MALMENPGRVLHPVDGIAPERLWVEVRQLDLCFRKSLGCHMVETREVAGRQV